MRPRLSTRYLAVAVIFTARMASALPGDVDAAFGTGGVVGAGNGLHAHFAAPPFVLQPDGKIVAGGSRPENGQSLLGVVRLQSDGSLDVGFGNAGVAGPALVDALALQPDGRIVVGAGNVVERLLPDGTVDPAFGTNGVVTVGKFVRCVVLQPDGAMLVGITDFHSNGPQILRLLSDGTFDPTFGSGGSISPGGTTTCPIVLQPDGNFIAASGFDLVPVRYDATGAVDPTFTANDPASALALQPDGKVLSASGITLRRLLSDGSSDATFGAGGAATVPLSPSPLENIGAIVVQDDGRIVVNASGDVARFHADGTIDTTMGNGGVALSGFNYIGFSPGNGLVRQPDGSLLVGRDLLERQFGNVCGNGVIEAGEQCDDGNVTPGDGCSATCCVSDPDGDGRCDSIDPCEAGVAAVGAHLKLRDRGITLRAQMTLPAPFAPALDPMANGIRLIVRAGDRQFDETIPGGGVDGAEYGWTTKLQSRRGGNKWTWMSRASQTTFRVSKVVVEDRSYVAPGLVRIRATTTSYYPLSVAGGPTASATFVLDSPTASTGQCGELTFPACRLNAGVRVLTCP